MQITSLPSEIQTNIWLLSQIIGLGEVNKAHAEVARKGLIEIVKEYRINPIAYKYMPPITGDEELPEVARAVMLATRHHVLGIAKDSGFKGLIEKGNIDLLSLIRDIENNIVYEKDRCLLLLF